MFTNASSAKLRTAVAFMSCGLAETPFHSPLTSVTGSAGLNEEVFDSLILLAAGEFTPAAIATGYARVQRLMSDMAEGRLARLQRLGFDGKSAQRLASLHTRNFM